MHRSLAIKLLLEGLFAALVLIVVLVSLVALANYHEQRTIEGRPSPVRQSFAVVTSEDGKSYQLVEWDASCEVWDFQSESDIVEGNFSAFEAGVCSLQVRPFLATTRHPGVRLTSGHRAESSSENASTRTLDE